MNKKRNLSKDLGIRDCENSYSLNVDIQHIKDAVHKAIASADSERKVNIMKLKKKIILIASAAVLVLGITAFAARGITKSWYSKSSAFPEYTSLPAAEQCIDDIGYAPVLIDTFENGYTFKEGSVVKNDLRDENNKSVEKFKSVNFRYEKSGDKVIVSQNKCNSELEHEGDIVDTVDGVDVYYFRYTNKNVPPDYEMTEEDKRAEENGDLVFSYGSDKVYLSEVQSVSFKKDDIYFNLMQIDGKLSEYELTDMAKEIISSK